MRFVADLHVHSCYSRATSQEAVPEELYRWALLKGVTLVGTGDFTHPAWRRELKEKLEPAEEGLYRLKKEHCPNDVVVKVTPGWPESSQVRFIVSGEISTIYKKNGRVRKIHHLILLPSLEAAEKISLRLGQVGNLDADGRPILGLDSRNLLELVLEACPFALFIPAHIWTPHFSLLGANSGFDSPEECFEDLIEYIFALETGLSSDPPMNWRLSRLDPFFLVSNSDAHSPRNLAREANVFDTDLSYPAIYRALKERDRQAFLGTIEFFPEEGKYHYDGHRACRVRWKPSETRDKGGICPVCGRRVTVGVLHRVEALADREEGAKPSSALPFRRLVPLPEVIGSALGVGTASRQVMQHYFTLLRYLGPEIFILEEAPLYEIARLSSPLVAEAVRRMRMGEIEVEPGFDGEFGKIILVKPEERTQFTGQTRLFEPWPAGMEEHVPSEANGSAIFEGKAFAVSRACCRTSWEGDRPADDWGKEEATQNSTLLSGLNAEQLKAVTEEEGPVVVIAGPGTGKTRTLVYRLAYLLQERRVLGGTICAVTFTNKAAQEIKERVGRLLEDLPAEKAITVGTFHSICLDLLRREYGLDFTLLDEFDALEVCQELLGEKAAQGKRKAKLLREKISLLKARGMAPSSPAVPKEIRLFYEAYQQRLADFRALDYDDVLLEALRREEERMVRGEPQRFTHLLVDEFQDVNPVQYRLVRVWAGDGRNLFVIGDPDQAIYGFRGADFRFFARLKEDFPTAKTVRLVLNYRSTPTVLKAACALLKKEEKHLTATRADGPKILHLEVPSERAEGIAIVQRIGSLVGGANMLQAHGQYAAHRDGLEEEKAFSFSDITVLFRTAHQAEALEECFLKEGIPYRLVGRESFLAEPRVKEIIDYLRAVDCPDDDFHLGRSLRRAGIKGEELHGLMAMAKGAGLSLGRFIEKLVETEGSGTGSSSLTSRVLPRLRSFQERLASYRSLSRMEPPAALILRLWEEGKHTEDKDIERLYKLAKGFQDLSSFLQRISLVEEADHERLGENASVPEAVTLMTLHAAKGLEFPVVFIAGVDEGIIPLTGKDPTEYDATAEEGGCEKDWPGSRTDLEEERRLFYVGMTRAQELLILLSARRRTVRGRQTLFTPSTFLQDIPPECLRKRVWKEERRRKDKKVQGEQLSLFSL